MKVQKTALALLMAFVSSISFLHAEEYHNALSFQGFTGLLNTPNALVTDQGKAYTVFSNQLEPTQRYLESAENYLFSIGLLPYLEFGGRFSEEQPFGSGGIRDLSASFKIRLPRFFEYKYMPDFAFGVQDVGGGSSLFQSRYGVMTTDIYPLRLSLGYGTGPDRMDGVFGGAEIRVFDWMYLLGSGLRPKHPWTTNRAISISL